MALKFTVPRHEPELIVPVKPTHRELKPLSDLDDQECNRYHLPVIHIYQHNQEMGNKNPVCVIREALSKVLVFYYPLAGRLKEGPGRKLMVDCSGECVLFVEAEADVTLEEFGVDIRPPIPCPEKLFYDLSSSCGFLESPLLLIQVTQLLCGGFIMGVRLNHTMMDAKGYLQFLTALSEIGNGQSTPSTLPVWQRELLSARNPPRVTCTHLEYNEVEDTDGKKSTLEDMENRSFFFGPSQISAIRRFLPAHLKRCTNFEVLTAYIWRCRTISLQPNPDDGMRIMIVVNARSKFYPPIPVGYYGNVFCYPVAISKASDLCNKPLSHALELVRKAKHEVTEEYARSFIDFMVINGRPNFTNVGSYIVSDVTFARFSEFDFGWGKAIYRGPDFDICSFFTHYNNHEGQSGIVVPVWLPSVAMKRFAKELNNILVQENKDHVIQQHVHAPSKL